MYQKKTQKWVLSTTIVALIFSFSISCFAFEKEIKTMTSVLSENILKAGRKTIAVVDFNDLQGNVTELGRFFAEEFSVALASAGKDFEVVDRTNLKTILIEHKLSTTGIIDPQTARKLGQIAGVDALITGTITPFGDTVRVTVKILDTNTARVIGATSGDIAKTKAIDELLSKGISGNSQNQGSSTVPVQQSGQGSFLKSAFKVDVNDLTFQVQDCKLTGDKLLCNVLVTNNLEDRDIYIYTSSYDNEQMRTRMIDQDGNENGVAIVQTGDRSWSTEKGQGQLNKIFPSGIPTRVSFWFKNITMPVTSITIDIAFATLISGWKYFRAQLKKIPVSN